MIAATGMLHGTAKSVAAQMMKMSPDKAMQLGIDAVQKMGAKMKGLPLTFNELMVSLKGLREEIFESLGAPILQALSGPMNELRGYFEDNKETILGWAHAVGDKVGEWVKDAAEEFKDGFEYVQDHAEQIKAAFKEGADDVRAVVDFVLAHKGAIAAAFGGKSVASGPPGGIGGSVAKGGGELAEIVKSIFGAEGGIAKAAEEGEEAVEAAAGGGAAEAEG